MQPLQERFEQELLGCSSQKEAEELHVRYLGRKGILQDFMKKLRDVPPAERPAFGAQVNTLKTYIEEKISSTMALLRAKEIDQQIASEVIDITLPARQAWPGSKHLVTAAIQDVVTVFKNLGFSVQVAPLVDTEYYNFDVLNFPPDHPAKDMQDTFYLEPGVLLRTHTSTVQGRFMERSSPPIRIVCPGRVFRNEEVSARSHVFFHQVEVLCVDEETSIQDLMWVMTEFVHRFFGPSIAVRFRPSYFPFVEPGIEADMECLICHGKGCSVCKHSGWLEILGAGMVHPQVLRNVGIDPEKYRGYALGLGIERTLMIRHGIKDIRHLTENDLRFLRQFRRL